MKVKVLLCLLFVVPMTLILSSYENGPEHHIGWDGTGATGSTGCSNGGGCHNSTTSLNTTVELDSAGVLVQSYHPGGSYTVKISAINNTTGTFGYFGFQLTTVMDSGAGTSGAIQAGTWGTQLPADVQNSPASGRATVPVIEHDTHIPALSGSGGTGTTYGVSIPWTAPPAGTGSIRIYGVINAVTGLDIAFLCDYQAATPVTITEATLTGISNLLPASLTSFNVYPTLMNDDVTLSINLKEVSYVTVSLLSMEGQTVRTFLPDEPVGAGAFKRSYDVSALPQGMYLVRLQIGNEYMVSKVVKE